MALILSFQCCFAPTKKIRSILVNTLYGTIIDSTLFLLERGRFIATSCLVAVLIGECITPTVIAHLMGSKLNLI